MTTPTYYTLLTKIGAATFTNAYAANTPVTLTHLAVGDGNGAAVLPDEDMTALVNERHRVLISSISQDAENPNWLIVEAVIPASVGGWTIREVGVIGTGGHLLVVGNFPETYKPVVAEGSARDLLIRVIFETSSAAEVTLVLDPGVVVATATSVANAVWNHEQKADPHPQYLTQPEGDARYLQVLPLATETQLGIAELATVAEAVAGADTERIVTPAGLSAAINARLAAERPKRFYHANL